MSRFDPFARSFNKISQPAPAAPRKQLVIFTSASLVAHQHLDHLMPFFAEMGVEPKIFITPGSKSPRAAIPSLKQFEYYDSGILEDVIYPVIEARKESKALTPTFNQLMRRHACDPVHVDSLKDPAILEAINKPGNIGAISIYQDAIFKPDLINAVKEKGFFWNLHPAVLPQDRGLWVLFWSLSKGKVQHGYTLHEIDEGIDTGHIIATRERDADPDKSIFESYVDFAQHGSKLVKNALSEYLRNGKVSFKPPSDKAPSYYTFPTEADISKGWKQGVRLWGTPQEMLKVYTNIFGNDKVLVRSIQKALAAAEGTPLEAAPEAAPKADFQARPMEFLPRQLPA